MSDRTVLRRDFLTTSCITACPAQVDVPRYIRAIRNKEYSEAAAVNREKLPLPVVCAYVCHAPCEDACCYQQFGGEPIAIRALKRVAMDNDDGRWKQRKKQPQKTGKKVAVVGAGPAGLTAAYYLASLGHAVTMFDSLPKAGGMMRIGIPQYRLPEKLLDNDIAEIQNFGVEIRTNTFVKSLDKLFEQDYDAIFTATGAHECVKLGIEGEDKAGVLEGLHFLREVNLGGKAEIGEKVAVVGGGNVAIDVSRVALRLGAKEVTIVYRRTEAEMPAIAGEVKGALQEGVKIHPLIAPVKISTSHGRLQLECIRMKLGEPDESGRARPIPIEGSSESLMEFDNVILAVGERPQIPQEWGLRTGEGGIIEADPETLATSRQGVFAGGDAVLGPASVVEAIAMGRKAAQSIDKYLGGTGVIDEMLALQEEAVGISEMPRAVSPREKMPILKPWQKEKAFHQVEPGFTEDQGTREADRCLSCDARRIGWTSLFTIPPQREEILRLLATDHR